MNPPCAPPFEVLFSPVSPVPASYCRRMVQTQSPIPRPRQAPNHTRALARRIALANRNAATPSPGGYSILLMRQLDPPQPKRPMSRSPWPGFPSRLYLAMLAAHNSSPIMTIRARSCWAVAGLWCWLPSPFSIDVPSAACCSRENNQS